MGENRNIFVIYTAEDTAVMQSILKRLKPFGEGSNVSIWNDDPIHPEQQWKPQNESRFNQTDLFLLLVSDTFMHSQFIQQLEFKMVIDRYKDGKSTVIPIIIDKCPWDIDFRSDDYNFSLNELQVLPKEGNPIKDWDSSEEAYKNIDLGIKAAITSFFGSDVQDESKKDSEEKVDNAKTEEQIAIRFNEEREAEEDKRRLEEVEAGRIAEEKKLKETEASKRRVEEEKNRLKKEAEAKSKVEEKKRLEEEAVAKGKVEAQKLKEEADAKSRAEEVRLREETEAKKRIEETKRKEEAAINQRLEESKRKAQEEEQQIRIGQPNKKNEEQQNDQNTISRKKLLVGALIVVLGIFAIWLLSKDSEEPVTSVKETNKVEIDATESLEPVKADSDSPEEKTEPLASLVIGDHYEGGIVFEIASDGKSGKVVHIDDAGPMPWADAIIIHDQLGKGWRLPTFEELKTLYNTVGQGASNSAEFANKLYWSATDYDEYQARLLQFRTGNTSYHYNKAAEHRKFLVRAIRDFSR